MKLNLDGVFARQATKKASKGREKKRNHPDWQPHNAGKRKSKAKGRGKRK